MKRCEDDDCIVGWWESMDSIVTLNHYIWMEKDPDQWRFKTMKEEYEQFKFCPRCGCDVEDLLKSH